jgi:SAM-dependent methyltransferase
MRCAMKSNTSLERLQGSFDLIDWRDLTPQCFARADEAEDALFYQSARKVVHIDEGAIVALTGFLGEYLQPGGRYLDLMSSWRSHYPLELNADQITGLGMNAEELADNPQLDEGLVHDLNTEPYLPFAEQNFDAVTCTVSVQYMTRPLEVFRAVYRVLKPGAPFILSFSNRCFPQKAIALWLAMDDAQHVELVSSYFAEHWRDIRTRNCPTKGDPLYIVWARRAD